MILMTQTGYLDNINSWSNNNKTLDDAEPVVAYSPATSVMYGNNSAWTSTIGPIKNAEYIALAYDAVLSSCTQQELDEGVPDGLQRLQRHRVAAKHWLYQPLRWYGGPLCGHDRRHYVLHLPIIDLAGVQRTWRRPVCLKPCQLYHLPHIQSKRPGANGRRHWSDHLLHNTYLFAIIHRYPHVLQR